jgi:hypothetical protein
VRLDLPAYGRPKNLSGRTFCHQSLPCFLIVATAFFAAAFRPFFPRVTFASVALLLSFLFLAAFFAPSLRFFFHSGVIMSASFVSKIESVVDHGQPIIFASRLFDLTNLKF